jgi:hypothetical protein
MSEDASAITGQVINVDGGAGFFWSYTHWDKMRLPANHGFNSAHCADAMEFIYFLRSTASLHELCPDEQARCFAIAK